MRLIHNLKKNAMQKTATTSRDSGATGKKVGCVVEETLDVKEAYVINTDTLLSGKRHTKTGENRMRRIV